MTSERAGKMQVAMLSDEIGEAARAAVLELANDGDLLERFMGDELIYVGVENSTGGRRATS